MRNRLNESLPRIARLFLYIWLGTIGLYIVGVIIGAGQPNQVYPKTLSDFLLVDVLVGVASFILMCIFTFFGAAINPDERKVRLVKSKKPSKSRATNRLSYYIAGGVAILIVVAGFLNQRVINLENAAKVNNYDTLKVTTSPSPTATPEVKGVVANPTVQNTDPIINCGISAECGGGSRQMKKSECTQTTCCQIGNKWYFYLSKTKCLADQASANQAKTPSYNTLPNYAPCTVYYPVLGYSQTYNYISPAQCLTWQQQAGSYSSLPTYTPPTSTPQPTMSPEEYQALLDQIQREINSCKIRVNEYYNQQVLNCNIQFGGSSAAEACTFIVNEQRDKELKACEQL